MRKRVLLPLDGSTRAEQALPHAVEQAERFRSELILLRAISPLLPGSDLSSELGWVQEQTGEWARDYLESIATQVRTRGIPVKVVIVREHPHEAITKFAEASSVDLIVICSRGQSGPSRWLMGSVADRVVRGATVPVLLVWASEQKNNSKWQAGRILVSPAARAAPFFASPSTSSLPAPTVMPVPVLSLLDRGCRAGHWLHKHWLHKSV